MKNDVGEGVFTQTSHGHESEPIPDAVSAPAMHDRHDLSHDKGEFALTWLLVDFRDLKNLLKVGMYYAKTLAYSFLGKFDRE